MLFVILFRPSYSQLPQHFPGVPVMALSATVTPDTLRHLQDALSASVLVKSSANSTIYYDIQFGKGKPHNPQQIHVAFSDGTEWYILY